MRRIALALATLLTFFITTSPARISADCSQNLLQNPGFEDGEYKTEAMGTSLSSSVANGWTPWSILGDSTYNREVEYKVLDVATLPNRYNIHSGDHAQKFFTTWGTHTAGFFQRVAVQPGSKVTFSIWVQIYTGERELVSNGHAISDLNWPTEANPGQGPGLYDVSIGIDPYGNAPVGFGAPPATETVWSSSVNEWDTRTVAENGEQNDIWVQLTVTTIAQSDYVTVYSKGQPDYPVKHNDSFWDDACLVAEAPPTPTPRPTNTPTLTPIATETLIPTQTSVPTETPEPTETPLPTSTATTTATNLPPTATATVSAETAEPATATLIPPTAVPASPSAQTPGESGKAESTGMWLIYGGIFIVALVLLSRQFINK